MLLLRRHCPSAKLVAWATAGALFGSLIGAFHPFIVLFAISEYLMSSTLAGMSKLVLLTAVCGAASGAVVGCWYRARIAPVSQS
jgi:hypothetical protein